MSAPKKRKKRRSPKNDPSNRGRQSTRSGRFGENWQRSTERRSSAHERKLVAMRQPRSSRRWLVRPPDSREWQSAPASPPCSRHCALTVRGAPECARYLQLLEEFRLTVGDRFFGYFFRVGRPSNPPISHARPRRRLHLRVARTPERRYSETPFACQQGEPILGLAQFPVLC
jgi:hypothetical protein